MKSILSRPTSRAVKTGADRLLGRAVARIEGKRIGLITNHTGRLSNGTSTIKTIADSGVCRLTTIFGPEHGVAGNTPDGVAVGHDSGNTRGPKVFSLYGDVQKPAPTMLHDVDVIVCDLQDIGARMYTYISTTMLALEAAAEAGLPFLLLDRPNPLRGLSFDGPVLHPSQRSFVGWLPTPLTTGLTLGELCLLTNNEGWLAQGRKADLHVVQLEGWKRSMWYDQTGLPWIAPSPNMQTLSTAIMYPGMCLVEGTNVSEGRGTDEPFQVAGAPWADPEHVLQQLDRFGVRGVRFSETEFTPSEIPGKAHQPKYEGELCRGIRISIVDRDAMSPVRLGLSILDAFKRAHPGRMTFDPPRFDRLAGTSLLREDLELGVPPDEIFAGWGSHLEAFGQIRAKHLLYS